MTSDLIAKMGVLSGPSREVDRIIDHHLFFPNEAPRNLELSIRDEWPVPAYTASLDAAIALVKRVLPGWGYRVATCCVSDDAWVFSDFNCPVHGERLKREFDESVDWVEITDVDLRPSGREPIALLIALLKAKEAQDG